MPTAIRAGLHHRHFQPAVRGLDAGSGIGATDRRAARPAYQAVPDLSKSHLPALRTGLAQFGYEVDEQEMFGDLAFWSVALFLEVAYISRRPNSRWTLAIT